MSAKFTPKGRRVGRPIKHGARALRYRQEIIAQYPELIRYTRACEDALIRDLAPEGIETLPAAKRIILDRLLSKLQTACLLDIYMGEHGILRQDKQNVLEAEPIVATWLQVNQAILKDLTVLGLERKKLEEKWVAPWDDQPEAPAQVPGEAENASPVAVQADSAHDPDDKGEEHE